MPDPSADSQTAPTTWWTRIIAFCRSTYGFITSVVTLIGIGFSAYHGYTDRGYGSCKIRPEKEANASRLSEYVSDAIRYQSHGSPELSIRQFKEVLKQDANFLGVNLDMGATYLGQNQLEKAQQAFDDELHLVDCLKTVKESDLPKFSYMFPSKQISSKIRPADIDYRKHLKVVEDLVHYNLACLRIRANDLDGAQSELKLAARNCSISPDKFKADPDLAPLRVNATAFAFWTDCHP